jgi:RNA-splicing ligase RtcB
VHCGDVRLRSHRASGAQEMAASNPFAGTSASLPRAVAAFAMPNIQSGYGFPVGGVVGVEISNPDAVVRVAGG